MRKYFCDKCGLVTRIELKNTIKNFKIRGETISFKSETIFCPKCKQAIFSEKYDEETIMKAYDIYRNKKRFLSAKTIRNIRENYGLSQLAFDRLLKWPKGTLFRYEQGYLQTKEQDILLRKLSDYRQMWDYLQINQELLKEEEYLRVAQIIKNSGYRNNDYHRITAIVLYLLNRCGSLYKTKLYKLLFYADMIAYKDLGQSLSGFSYYHYAYGPYPKGFDRLLDRMVADRYLYFENERLSSKQIDIQGVLQNSNMEVLDKVATKFKDFDVREIILYSHQEKAYYLSKDGDRISYDWSKEIEL